MQDAYLHEGRLAFELTCPLDTRMRDDVQDISCILDVHVRGLYHEEEEEGEEENGEDPSWRGGECALVFPSTLLLFPSPLMGNVHVLSLT